MSYCYLGIHALKTKDIVCSGILRMKKHHLENGEYRLLMLIRDNFMRKGFDKSDINGEPFNGRLGLQKQQVYHLGTKKKTLSGVLH